MANNGAVERKPKVDTKPVPPVAPQVETYIWELQTGKANTKQGRLVAGDQVTGTSTQYSHDKRFKLLGPGVAPPKVSSPESISGVKLADEPQFEFELQSGKCHTKNGVLLPGAKKVAHKHAFDNDKRWKLIGPIKPTTTTALTKFSLTAQPRGDGSGWDVFKEGESKPLNNAPLTEEEAHDLVGVSK